MYIIFYQYTGWTIKYKCKHCRLLEFIQKNGDNNEEVACIFNNTVVYSVLSYMPQSIGVFVADLLSLSLLFPL